MCSSSKMEGRFLRACSEAMAVTPQTKSLATGRKISYGTLDGQDSAFWSRRTGSLREAEEVTDWPEPRVR